MLGFAKKLFGSPNDRTVKSFRARALLINALDDAVAQLCESYGATG
jgi:preprotein translocase subunit SecA